MSKGFGLVCMLAAAWGAGCAHLPGGEDGLGYRERQIRLQAVHAWEMSGRIAVNTGQQAFQGRFQWHQSDEAIELSVRSALGAGVLEVAGPPDRLIVRARGETWELSDPEAELSAILGWWLPVSSLSAWLLGSPDPLFPSRERLGAGRALHTLEQRLWQLTYASYQLSGGLLLPRRIDLAHGRIELRVVVDRWQPLS